MSDPRRRKFKGRVLCSGDAGGEYLCCGKPQKEACNSMFDIDKYHVFCTCELGRKGNLMLVALLVLPPDRIIMLYGLRNVKRPCLKQSKKQLRLSKKASINLKNMQRMFVWKDKGFVVFQLTM